MMVQTFPFAQNELFFNSQNHSFAFIFNVQVQYHAVGILWTYNLDLVIFLHKNLSVFHLCNVPQPPLCTFMKKDDNFTTGENFAIIDQHPIGGGGGGGCSLLIMPCRCMEPQRVWFLTI